jgi:hypothetical protein
MPKMRMVMYCEIADAGPDEPWLEKFVESFGSFPPGAAITTNVDQEVSSIAHGYKPARPFLLQVHRAASASLASSRICSELGLLQPLGMPPRKWSFASTAPMKSSTIRAKTSASG